MKTYQSYAVALSVAALLLPGQAYAVGDLSDWLYHLSTQVPALIKLLVAVAYVSGFGFLVGAVMKLRKCAQGASMMSSHESLGGPMIHLVVGAALLYFAGFIEVGSVTLFGKGSVIAYQSSYTSDGLAGGVMGPIVLILRLVGYIAFIKGLYILGRLGGSQSQPGTLGKGIIHLVGGVMAVNIEATYLVLLNTLQGSAF